MPISNQLTAGHLLQSICEKRWRWVINIILPVAVEVAVYHTGVLVRITGIAAAVHIAGVIVVV